MNVLVLSALESTATFPPPLRWPHGEIFHYCLPATDSDPLQKDDEMVMHNLNGDNGEARETWIEKSLTDVPTRKCDYIVRGEFVP